MMGCTVSKRCVKLYFVTCIFVDLLLQAYLDYGVSGHYVCKYKLVVSCSLLLRVFFFY